MKKFFIVGLMALGLAACDKVPAGNVGVKVDLYGSEKGINTEELSPGRYWIGINEELYIFPTFDQNYVWTASEDEGSEDNESISFQTSEGLTVNADVGITYRIDPSMVNQIFAKYRKGIEEITDLYLRNIVRDAFVTVASSKRIESVYGEGKAEFITEVEQVVRDQVEPIGINVERVYWAGELRLPESVTRSLNLKIEASQRAQQRRNEIEEQKAEAQKKIEAARGEAESIRLRAEAEAEANETVARSLTDELVRYRAIENWDGVLPRMTGDGAVPFINMTQEANPN